MTRRATVCAGPRGYVGYFVIGTLCGEVTRDRYVERWSWCHKVQQKNYHSFSYHDSNVD